MAVLWKKRLISESDLMSLHEKLKEKGLKVVFTAGSWDLLHVGQCRYLEVAKTYGDILVVGISSNAAIRKIKGPNKPVLDEMVRAEMLSYLKPVDFMTILPEPSCQPALGLLQPNIYITIKEDWTDDYLNSKEYKTVIKYGGEVKMLDRQSTSISTTKIIQRAVGSHLSDVFKDFIDLRKEPLKEHR